MSFSTNIKNEISNIMYSKAESMSELSAILNIGADLKKDSFSILTENPSVARRIYKLIKDLYHVNIIMDKENLNRNRKNYLIEIKVTEKTNFILKDLSLINNNNSRKYVPKEYLISEFEEKQAYLRGVFLICGSINDPKTSRYHMEFMIEHKSTAYFVSSLLNELNYKSKVLKRDKNYMVYVKESEKISDFIKLLNAYTSLFYYEDIRIYRDHKNMTNRLNNCEQANIDKIIASSNAQLKNIDLLLSHIDFELLDEKTQEIITYKKKYPESSMEELASIITSETGHKISKSGINHRFRKIKEMLNKFD